MIKNILYNRKNPLPKVLDFANVLGLHLHQRAQYCNNAAVSCIRDGIFKIIRFAILFLTTGLQKVFNPLKSHRFFFFFLHGERFALAFLQSVPRTLTL